MENKEIDASFHPVIKDDLCCYRSSSKVINLAKKYSSDLHVLHLTTEKEIQLFSNASVKEKNITCEVCVHHLWFDETDYAQLGNLIVCNPAIKKVSDRNALRQALKDGFIDYVATDHAPHSLEDKKALFRSSGGYSINRAFFSHNDGITKTRNLFYRRSNCLHESQSCR